MSRCAIVARKLDDGRIEFGLQQRQTDDTWGDRQLHASASSPPPPPSNRWLASSTLDLPVGDVRIVARKLDSGRVEFGLQQRQTDDTWGDRQLPRVRFLPTTATVDRWLASSPFALTAVTCVDVPTHDGERWCAPPPVGDTIQLFSEWAPPGSQRSVSRCGGPGLRRRAVLRQRPHPRRRVAGLPHPPTRAPGRHHHRGLRHRRTPVRRFTG